MTDQPKIEQVGRPDWPRYRITLGRCVWTGEGWDSDASAAVLYASWRVAVPAWRDVMSRYCGHHKEITLTTKLTVTVRVSDGWKLDDLIVYLGENACVQLDQAPIILDAAILDFQVAWNQLRVEGDGRNGSGDSGGENVNDIFE